MLDIIGEFIFGDLLGWLFVGLFKMVYMLGISILQVLYLFKHSHKRMSVKFRDSSIPYFLGFGSIALFVLLLKTIF